MMVVFVEAVRGRAVVDGAVAGTAVGWICSGGTVVLVALVVAGALVVVVGAGAGAPHSPGAIGFGGCPSIAGGTSNRGGGAPAPTLPSENDHPSTEPGGGVREPGPTVE